MAKLPQIRGGACRWLSVLSVAAWFSQATLGQVPPKLYSVLASAEVQSGPVQIRLVWPADPSATSYTVARKELEGTSWTGLGFLPGTATSFTDLAVSPGSAYEYQIVKTTPDYSGYQYLLAGLEAPLVDQRGTVILLVANTYAGDLAAELTQLEQDLTGDGWTVLRHDVSPDANVTDVKALIKADYDADPIHVEALFLFGRIPVPYSGNISPDGHTNHTGAWPADVYYGDMHGLWTDSSVTSTNAERTRNWNIPGDGKFDQGSPPGRVDLQIGRVDLSNMTCFANKTPSRSEPDLLRQYLRKDHNFRLGLMTVERRALICDNFFDKGSDPIGCSGWRNFSAFFGPSNITEVGWSNYFPAVTAQSYLWTFASGGGQYYTCTGVGSSDDFALQDMQAVFTMWLGSYFGDWDNESNFLRAPLGSTSYTLTSSYSGFPQWLYHPMALGQTAGYCARLTQNNHPRGLYPPFNPGAGQVHVCLLGDPTLRLHPVLPPSALTAASTATGLKLTWTASADTGLRGYHVYRAASSSNSFVRITGNLPTTNTSFADAPPAGAYTYMVRAIKLEHSGSGTYLNASQGAFVSATSDVVGNPPAPNLSLSISRQAAAVQLRITGHPGQNISVEFSADLSKWTPFLTNTVANGIFEFTDPLAPGSAQRFYKCRSL
jgi:hypothetical protein